MTELRSMYCLLFEHPGPPSPVAGKFMVCPGHRLQCTMPNHTNHKFPSDRDPGVRSEVKSTLLF